MNSLCEERQTIHNNVNIEVQADFLTAKTDKGKYEILNIVDTSTSFGERRIVE